MSLPLTPFWNIFFLISLRKSFVCRTFDIVYKLLDLCTVFFTHLISLSLHYFISFSNSVLHSYATPGYPEILSYLLKTVFHIHTNIFSLGIVFSSSIILLRLISLFLYILSELWLIPSDVINDGVTKSTISLL